MLVDNRPIAKPNTKSKARALIVTMIITAFHQAMRVQSNPKTIEKLH